MQQDQQPTIDTLPASPATLAPAIPVAPLVPPALTVDVEALISEYKTSQQYVEQFTRDFVQLDNLVDGVPLMKDEKAPFVGDTTLPGLVRSIPRSSLKQLPVLSAKINGAKNSVTSLVATYLLKKTAFNEDTFGKGLLSTMQIGAEQALTHGYAPFMVATGQMYNDFGTSMRLLHYSDASLEPGVYDSNESGYHFVTAHLTPTRVKRILRAAKNNEATSWNVAMLEKLLENSPKPKNYSRYESAPRRVAGGDQGSLYEVITRYETGSNSQFITFSPDIPEAPLRVLESKSKWGYPRVQYLVIDPAALTPFGISRVRLASPNQNFMNIYYGNIASMLLLNSNPPIFKRGVFTKPTNLKRGAVWESLDPNAEISLKTMDNGSLSQFPTIAQSIASQIQNIMGGQSLTVNAGSKAAAFGHTAPGVQAGQALMDIETNQITNILENFLRQYALVALDTLLSEQTGEDIIIVDDDTMNAINQVAPDTIGDDHKFSMNWDDFYASIEEIGIDVDISLSPDQMKDKQRGDLQDLLTVLGQNAAVLGPEAVSKVQDITNMLIQDKAPTVKTIQPATVPTQLPAPGTPPTPPEGLPQ